MKGFSSPKKGSPMQTRTHCDASFIRRPTCAFDFGLQKIINFKNGAPRKRVSKQRPLLLPYCRGKAAYHPIRNRKRISHYSRSRVWLCSNSFAPWGNKKQNNTNLPVRELAVFLRSPSRFRRSASDRNEFGLKKVDFQIIKRHKKINHNVMVSHLIILHRCRIEYSHRIVPRP